ncbi:hypothetical protein Rsub_06378 [Raphidocelis subcapitata]|uniref:Uncharacterized protein n=1 Tax=Raphidocelis subcapitata TaxID=307507 RepID=A0A2V0P657_9CHLO|nr:hypothetical protein Rsub_06378 [Raphidocelis subcapitata]|eukprot:GBF93340.1 hypothetical protein Rsub_06378 [Raphidocelis subcapitata]
MAFALSNKLSLRQAARPAPAARRPVAVVRAAAAAGEVPDMNKRNIMNLILLGGLPEAQLRVMGLSRGAFKIGAGFVATYALVWGNWDRLATSYNDRSFARMEQRKVEQQLERERRELLGSAP